MSKKRNALRSVLGAFVELKDETAAEKPQAQPVQKEAVKEEAPQPVVPPTAPNSPALTQGQEDDQMKEDLVKALEEANIEGYDFFEFRAALINMASVIPTEVEQFKAAYAAVSSMVTPDHLVKTANHYIAILQGKAESFAEYVEAMKAEKVLAKTEEADAVQQEIENMSAQIEELNKKIAEKQEHRRTCQAEAIEADGKIQQVKMNFDTTCNTIINKIQADARKIETYLGVSKPEEKKAEVTNE